jgi:hypothetical protein
LQVVGGLLLLTAISVPLGLILLGPVIINMIMFHLFMDRKGIGLALFILFFRSSCGNIAPASPLSCRIRANDWPIKSSKIENFP